MRPGPTKRWPAAARSVCCTACPWRTRTSWTRRGFALPSVRRSTATTCRRATRCIVTRIREAGAITVGKTNTPEFGAGSQTFNTVFGATRNPYDLARTCGGSSGGAAVAARLPDAADRRRQRHRWLASQPAGILQRRRAAAVTWPCAARVDVVVAVVGVRADRADGGRRRVVPERASRGPIPAARCRSRKTARVFERRSDRTSRAFVSRGGASLGGIPFEPEIRRVVDANRKVFEGLGCVVEEAEPDFTGVDEAFPVLRYRGQSPAVRAAHPRSVRTG